MDPVNINVGQSVSPVEEKKIVKSDIGKTYAFSIKTLCSSNQLEGWDWIQHIFYIERWVPIGIVNEEKGIFNYVKLSEIKKYISNDNAIDSAVEVKILKTGQTGKDERMERAKKMKILIMNAECLNMLNKQNGKINFKEYDDFIQKCNEYHLNGINIIAINIKNDDNLNNSKNSMATHLFCRSVSNNNIADIENTANFIRKLYPNYEDRKKLVENIIDTELKNIFGGDKNKCDFFKELIRKPNMLSHLTDIIAKISLLKNRYSGINVANEIEVKNMQLNLDEVHHNISVKLLKEQVTKYSLNELKSKIDFRNILISEKLFKKVIEDLKSELPNDTKILILERIFKKFTAVMAMQKSAVKDKYFINNFDLFKICASAEIVLESYNIPSTNHIIKTNENLKHPIVIDFKSRKFTILLESSAKIQAEGGFGKVESVIIISDINTSEIDNRESIARHFVKKTGKNNKLIDQEEIKWAKRYQQGAHELTYVNRNGNIEKSLVTEGFDGSLFEALHKQNFTISEIRDIMHQIATQLSKIHSDNNVHCDLKLKNILFRRNPNNSIQVQISDFGLTNSSGLLYGTSKFSSPRLIQARIDGISTKSNKNDDIYALGLIAYMLYFKTEPSHLKNISNYIKNNIVNIKELRNIIYEQNNLSNKLSIIQTNIVNKFGDQDESASFLNIINQLLAINENRRIGLQNLCI